MRGASLLHIPAIALALLACSDGPLTTDPLTQAGSVSSGAATDNAAVYWNGIARGLVAKNSSSAPFAIRAYAIMALAQHNAAAVTQNGGVHAAISAASVVTLSYLYPTEHPALETLLQQYLSAAGGTEGETIGRTVGAQVVGYAQTDRFFAPWTGTVPVGPGIWFSSSAPVGAAFGQAKTYFLRSGNQFRPAPHPAFGSPAFLDALAEVRRFSDTRTREQDSLAKFWNLPNGTHTPPGYWNEEGARLVVKYGFDERKAAHLLALTNMVSFDAIVASHEAKYTYWLLRPTMADPAIQLPIPLPNFPSYPSNHAAISAGMADVLGAAFPSERLRLRQLADQAALSRVYGGIHYRFDGTAGLTLGRSIAAWALDHDVKVREPFVLR